MIALVALVAEIAIVAGYGLFVDTINGETANYNVDGSYWAAYVNGKYGQYGVDSQPVSMEMFFHLCTQYIQNKYFKIFIPISLCFIEEWELLVLRFI